MKPGDSAGYSRVCVDARQRLKGRRQADVLLLMSRFPERFSPEEKLAAWEDFEPLCIHDSTLSFATHALFAAQCGLSGAAKRYFDKALWLDLREVMGNTGKEGLHLACLGETYQAVVFGFAGLVDYLVKKMKREMKQPNIRVVATGGFSEIIAGEISCIDYVDKLLTPQGLKYLTDIHIGAQPSVTFTGSYRSSNTF